MKILGVPGAPYGPCKDTLTSLYIQSQSVQLNMGSVGWGGIIYLIITYELVIKYCSIT